MLNIIENGEFALPTLNMILKSFRLTCVSKTRNKKQSGLKTSMYIKSCLYIWFVQSTRPVSHDSKSYRTRLLLHEHNG